MRGKEGGGGRYIDEGEGGRYIDEGEGGRYIDGRGKAIVERVRYWIEVLD